MVSQGKKYGLTNFSSFPPLQLNTHKISFLSTFCSFIFYPSHFTPTKWTLKLSTFTLGYMPLDCFQEVSLRIFGPSSMELALYGFLRSSKILTLKFLSLCMFAMWLSTLCYLCVYFVINEAWGLFIVEIDIASCPCTLCLVSSPFN